MSEKANGIVENAKSLMSCRNKPTMKMKIVASQPRIAKAEKKGFSQRIMSGSEKLLPPGLAKSRSMSFLILSGPGHSFVPVSSDKTMSLNIRVSLAMPGKPVKYRTVAMTRPR